MSKELCPCCSGKTYQECCEPLIKDEALAKNPEAMMRSRYTAYAKVEMDHLLRSTHPDQRGTHDEDAARKWAEDSEWDKLEIVSTTGGGKEDTEGTVEFIASYREKGIPREYHENASFKKMGNEWYFYDAKLIGPTTFVREKPKVSRNEPCPCGSGKKYKKCCG
jgi:SEC-C motif-containing protein